MTSACYFVIKIAALYRRAVITETSLKSLGMLQRREDPQVLSELNSNVVFSANSENNYSYDISKCNFAKEVFKA